MRLDAEPQLWRLALGLHILLEVFKPRLAKEASPPEWRPRSPPAEAFVQVGAGPYRASYNVLIGLHLGRLT